MLLLPHMQTGLKEVIDNLLTGAVQHQHAVLSRKHQDTLHLNMNAQRAEEVQSGH